jgi:hypothetical protein
VRLFIFPKLTVTAMCLTDLPMELLSAIFGFVDVKDFRNIVLTHKCFHPAVAHREISRVIKTFEGLRSIIEAKNTFDPSAADIIIQRAAEMLCGLGFSLIESQIYRRETRREKVKHLTSALLLGLYIPYRWTRERYLTYLGRELKKLLHMCVEARNWPLASEVLEPLGKLPRSMVDYGSLPASVSTWITKQMGSLPCVQLARASDVLRLIDPESDTTLLAAHIRRRVERSEVMYPDELLLLQDVSSPIDFIERSTDTLRKLYEQGSWIEVHKLLKLFVRLPAIMGHSKMIELVKEISCGFTGSLDSANVDEAVSNLTFCEHICVGKLKSTTITSIVKFVENRMNPETSLGSDNHRVLQNLPPASDLTSADFATIRVLLQEQLLYNDKKVRNCYDLQSRLDILYRLPPYLNILDLSLTGQLPDQWREMIVLRYYMPITACEQDVHPHRRYLIDCIHDRHFWDATTALELIRDRLFGIGIVKTHFLDILEKLQWQSLLIQTTIECFILYGKSWQARVSQMIQECQEILTPDIYGTLARYLHFVSRQGASRVPGMDITQLHTALDVFMGQ